MDLCREANYFRNNKRRRIAINNETPQQASIRRTNRTESDRLRRAAHSISDISLLTEHHCGEMAEVCEFCHALYWKKEENTSGQYAKCCHGGKVRLPELTQTPNLLLDLLTGNSPDSKNYRSHIREYNAALAFASMGAQIKPQVFDT